MTQLTDARKHDIIENWTYLLIGAQADLRRLPEHHGDRRFLEAQMLTAQQKIAYFESLPTVDETPEPSDTIQVTAYGVSVPEAVMQRRGDFFQAAEEFLAETARAIRKKSKQEVFYLNKGVLQYVTLYHLITSGIPGRVRGLKSLATEWDVHVRLAGILYLVAMVKLILRPITATTRPVFRVEEMTPDLLTEQLRVFVSTME